MLLPHLAPRPSVLLPHLVAPRHLVLLPHLVAPQHLVLHRRLARPSVICLPCLHNNCCTHLIASCVAAPSPGVGAAPSASAFGAPSQLGGASAFGTCAFQRYTIPRPGLTQRVSFVRTQVALVLSALLKAVVLLAPLKVVVVGLRATLLKLPAVDLGLWRRQAALHLRRRLEDTAETKSTDNGALVPQ